jgi:hypothetical protein
MPKKPRSLPFGRRTHERYPLTQTVNASNHMRLRIMPTRAAPQSDDLRTTLHGIVERFATACGGSASRGQLRVMADDLVLDLVGALRNASLGDISAVVALLERQQKNRPAPKVRAAKPAATTKAQRGAPEPQPSNRRDAFEITMPSELLDSVARTPPRDEEHPPASVRRVRPASAPRVTPRAPRTPRVLEPVAPPVPERPPVVSLREGEQLVRASGSGVIIRRARTA